MSINNLYLNRFKIILTHLLLISGLCLINTTSALAQGNVTCPSNIDFENGDFSTWVCFTADAVRGTGSPKIANAVVTAPVANRHVITQYLSSADTDLYGHFPVVPPGGGNYAARVGNDQTGAQADVIRYYIHVPVGFNDYSFSFRYAAVLWSGGHPAAEQPAFQVSAYDSATGLQVPCANLLFVADAGLPGFKTSDVSPYPYYCDWTGAALPIINQGGKTIVIEIFAYDCTQGGHFGYGYFDVVNCGKYKAAVSYCNLDSGFVRFFGTGIKQIYNWYSSNGTFVGKGPYVEVPVPNTPDYFYGVLAAGDPGCLDTVFTDTVSNFLVNATPPISCVRFGSSIQLDVNTTGGVGGFTYSWDANPDLSSRTIKNPIATPNDTTYYVTTVSDKVGCFRKDTIKIYQAPDAGPDLKVCPLGERPAQLYVQGPNDVDYHWYDATGSAPGLYLNCTDCRNPLSAPTDPVYTYLVNYDGCDLPDTLVVYHDTSNYIVAPQDPLIVCRPRFENLLSEAFGPKPRLNLECGTSNVIACAAADQDTATTSTVLNMPAKDGANTPFYSEKTYSKYQFIIPKKDLFYADFFSGTINSMAFRTLASTVIGAGSVENMTISLACVDYDTYPQPLTNNSFIQGLTPVATVTNYTLTPDDWNQIDFTTPYNWDTSKNLLVDICMGPMTTPNAAGTNGVAMMGGYVIHKYDAGINVCGGNAPKVYGYEQRPVVRFMYCPTPELPFKYTWSPGTYLNDSTTQNPTAYIPRTIDYAVYSIGRNGCRLRDSLHVIIPEHKLMVGPMDTFACLNQEVYMRASGGDAYQWFEVQGGAFTSASGSLSCTDCANPIAMPRSTTTYAIVFSNNIHQSNPINPNYETGCPDTLYTTVNIWALPPVRSSNRDTTIAYGKSVQLFARGAANYTWTPVGSLNDPNSPAPIASPKETTNYIVAGKDSNGCVYRDTVKVSVDYRDNLLIPTGFTPNGDGRNDVFKVVNPSFQRLMEFRVFNRWGQEVFSTTDINSGWDGRWKNVLQDVGNYQYLIRVAYPDGNVETYKGDVSLIR